MNTKTAKWIKNLTRRRYAASPTTPNSKRRRYSRTCKPTAGIVSVYASCNCEYIARRAFAESELKRPLGTSIVSKRVPKNDQLPSHSCCSLCDTVVSLEKDAYICYQCKRAYHKDCYYLPDITVASDWLCLSCIPAETILQIKKMSTSLTDGLIFCKVLSEIYECAESSIVRGKYAESFEVCNDSPY